MTINMATWARIGAEARLAEIDAERASIIEAFPDLGRKERHEIVAAGRQILKEEIARNAASTRRSRPTMTPAQRSAVSRRMKAYWRKRRQEKG